MNQQEWRNSELNSKWKRGKQSGESGFCVEGMCACFCFVCFVFVEACGYRSQSPGRILIDTLKSIRIKPLPTAPMWCDKWQETFWLGNWGQLRKGPYSLQGSSQHEATGTSRDSESQRSAYSAVRWGQFCKRTLLNSARGSYWHHLGTEQISLLQIPTEDQPPSEKAEFPTPYHHQHWKLRVRD